MTDTTPTYAVGELVDITIRGARVRGYYGAPGPDGPGDDLMVSYGGHYASDLNLALDAKGVTVERMAPAEWPPQYKQIWQDSDGDLWTMTRLAHPDRVSYRLTCADSSKGSGIYSPAELLERYGPLELIHDANPPADTEDGES